MPERAEGTSTVPEEATVIIPLTLPLAQAPPLQGSAPAPSQLPFEEAAPTTVNVLSASLRESFADALLDSSQEPPPPPLHTLPDITPHFIDDGPYTDPMAFAQAPPLDPAHPVPLDEATVILTRGPAAPPAAAAAPARAELPPADEPELRTEKLTRPPEMAAPAPRRDQGPAPPTGLPRAPTPQRPTGSRPSLPAPAPPLEQSLTEPAPPTPALDWHRKSLSHGMRLGGYQLLRKLGAGAMGTVWLARQLSLARDVAVKILRPSLAQDPQFVYRFTQEAFAAAQLVHHNIVQIYDCGSEKQVYFYSMEYVDAESLQSLIAREGRLDPEVAAGYILQAARGLKFAHDRGMIHRDIKPDNLLLNRNGIVKVADMGLVKRSGQELGAGDRTDVHPLHNPAQDPQASDTGGTPAYMSPEQVENSADVDARSDIYSLGCTFYFLLTGRPPFQSESVAALMGMHVVEPPIPPEELVRRVPKALSDIVLRMLAKLPEERFQNLGELIRELEAFLGIEGTTVFSPREEHANLLERCVLEYNRAPWGWRRRMAVLGFAGVSALATGLAAWRGSPLVAGAVAAFSTSTWMLSFTLRGLFHKGTLFLHVRQFILSAPLGIWLVWLLLLGGAGYGLYRFGLLELATGLLGGALLAATGFYFLVDREVAAERQPFLEEVEVMLRAMRLRGLEEGALRQFVCKYSGDSWESFYEALFGYEAKLLAREKWGRNERGLPREKHAAWRDPLIRGMELLQQALKHRRERRQLRMLERKKERAQEQEKAQAAPT